MTPKTKHSPSKGLFTPAILSIAGVIVFWLAALGVLTVVQKPLAFTYDGKACISQWTLLPGEMHQTSTSDYTVVFKDTFRIGDWPVAATKTCLTPTTAVKAGDTTLSYSLFGWGFPGKSLALTVPEAPVANIRSIVGQTISVARPLDITLSAPDVIHDYELTVGQLKAGCRPADKKLSCAVDTLDLRQGQQYDIAVTRAFKGQKAVTLGEGTVTTQQPIKLTQQSLQNEQVIYDKPTEFSFTFDKEVVRSDIKLVRLEKETREPVSIKTQASGQKVTVVFTDQLPRNAHYELLLNQVESRDGSSLDDPLPIRFSTSGGPKVSGVSVGNSGVAQNAQITVTFDQPIDESVDIGKFATLNGVPGSVRKTAPNQLVYSLQGATLCTAFSLVVEKGIKSGSNDETSSETWEFDSRTICGTSSVIGYSVRGRPIIAYYFGNGPSTVLFTGAIHGNERSTQQTMQAWVDHLMSNAHRIPAGKRVVVVPNVNPDGIATGSRNNARNVNLGRNFATANWSAQIDTASGTLPTGGGTSPTSEPEAAALANLTRQLRPRLEVSFHSQGRLVGANKYSDSVAIGNIYASMVGYGTMYYNAEDVMGYAMTGEYEDWMGESMGIPAILIELPSHYGNYLPSQLNALWKMVSV